MEGLRGPTPFAEFVAKALAPSSTFTLFDIGCSGGIDSAWRVFGKSLRAYGFDPNIAEVARLKAAENLPGVDYMACFVGYHQDTPGAARAATSCYWDRNPWSRLSIARTQDIRAREFAAADSAAKTSLNLWSHVELADPERPVMLDRFCAERGIEGIDFVKIDVDGPDYLILQSIGSLLVEKRVLGLCVEVNFFGSDDPEVNTFHNMDRLLRSLGFDLFDLTVRRYSVAALPSPYLLSIPAQTISGRPFQGDAIYLRDLAAQPSASKPDPAAFAKLAAIFSLISQPDGAAEILERHRAAVATLCDVDAALDALVAQVHVAKTPQNYRDYMADFEANSPFFYPAPAADALPRLFVDALGKVRKRWL